MNPAIAWLERDYDERLRLLYGEYTHPVTEERIRTYHVPSWRRTGEFAYTPSMIGLRHDGGHDPFHGPITSDRPHP